MTGNTPFKKLILAFSPILLVFALYFSFNSLANAQCSGCGSSTGSGSYSGGYPTFNYDSIYYSVQFPSCPNPGGTVRGGYDTGTHWIPGYSDLKTGSDYVYDIGNNNFVQCYCPEGAKDTYNNINNGLQTNWIKADKISDAQRGYLLRTGWKLVEKGEEFGLPAGEYLYFNQPFACGTINCLPYPTTTPFSYSEYGRTNIGNESAGVYYMQ